MSEEQNLKQARNFIDENNKPKAVEILWKLYQSDNQKIKLDTILCLLVILDRSIENNKIIEIIDEGLKIAPKIDKDIEAYLLIQKCCLLLIRLSLMIYRQKNLKLAAQVFKWINFSTEREKEEFELIIKQKQKIEEETQRLEDNVCNYIQVNKSHRTRGRIFLELSEIYNLKYSNNQLDLMIGGKKRSWLGNKYLIKRWNLGKWFLYNSKGRKKLKENWHECLNFMDLAISEFKAGRFNEELAHAYYNLAVKYQFIFQFRKAKKALKLALKLAEEYNCKRLLAQITLLGKRLKEKNKNIKNYVEEFGLDLP